MGHVLFMFFSEYQKQLHCRSGKRANGEGTTFEKYWSLSLTKCIVRCVNCIAQKYFLVKYLSQIKSQLLSN